MNNIKRDISLDILRCIALIGIIVIHIHPESLFVRQIRNFDVPMMVFLSGVSYVLSNRNKRIEYSSYCVKRFKRLILPSWIFLAFYYLIFHIIYFIVSSNAHILWDDMLHSFTFFTGWYVWIIRVFFIIALCAPLISIATYKVSQNGMVISCIVILFLYEFIPLQREDSVIYYLGMVIPYLNIFSIGLVVNKFTKRQLLILSAIFMLIYISYAVYYFQLTGSYQETSIKKYPPKLYYTSFAISISLILFISKNYILSICDKLRIVPICEFLGSHTIWIYFWHIPIVKPAMMILSNGGVRFILVISLATIITYIQVKTVDKVMRETNKDSVRKNLKILFVG